MRFWDTSALAPLVLEDRASVACRHLLRTDAVQMVWCLTRAEMISATWRLHRDGKLARREVARAERRIELLAERWTEIDALLPVRDQAQRLLVSTPSPRPTRCNSRRRWSPSITDRATVLSFRSTRRCSRPPRSKASTSSGRRPAESEDPGGSAVYSGHARPTAR